MIAPRFSSGIASRKETALRRAAGQVLLVGLEGPSLSAAETAWLKLVRPGGIILFRRNVESAGQVHALLQATRKAAAEIAPLFRSIDVEGGTVDRLRDLVAPMPSASAVASTRNPKLFAAHGALIAKEIRMLSLNLTFAPVLDLRTEWSEPVMTTRVVSNHPREVVEYARHFLRGLAKEGVLGCGKHFPGLGGGAVDSHFSTPRIEKPFASLWKEDLLPYRKLAARLPMAMVSHASYPLTPSGAEPASISHFWTTEILVKKIQFRGLIVSDDMEMGGILSQAGLADAALRALLAGIHLIAICRDPALVLNAYEALMAEARRSPVFSRKLLQAARRVEEFKRKRLKGDRLPRVPAAAAIGKMRSEIERFSEKVSGMRKVQQKDVSA